MASVLYLLLLVLNGAVSQEVLLTQLAPNNSTAAPSRGELAKLDVASKGIAPRADVAIVDGISPDHQVKGQPAARVSRLERIDHPYYMMSPRYGMSPYGMENSMPMQPGGYFYPHRMAPTLPPYDGRRHEFKVTEVSRRRKVVPHPRLVEAPHLSTDINTISEEPDFGGHERGSRPYGSRKRDPERLEPVFFDDDDDSATPRRPYPYGARRSRKRPYLRYKPSPFEMTNGHGGPHLSGKRRQGEGDNDDERYGLLQSDKKTFVEGGKRRFLPAPPLYVVAEDEERPEDDHPPAAASQSSQIENYQPPQRSFVLGPAGYQLEEVNSDDSASVAVPSRVESVPLVGETRRRLISYVGAREYFDDEAEDYVPAGLKTPLSERRSSRLVEREKEE